MSIFTAIEQDFEAWWANHVKPFLHDDVEPTLKSFVSQFTSAFGQQAIKDALAAVTSLAGGASFGTVATGLATTLYTQAKTEAATDASLTAEQILQLVQSALQVAKSANNVVTPTDTTAAASIKAA